MSVRENCTHHKAFLCLFRIHNALLHELALLSGGWTSEFGAREASTWLMNMERSQFLDSSSSVQTKKGFSSKKQN